MRRVVSTNAIDAANRKSVGRVRYGYGRNGWGFDDVIGHDILLCAN